MYLGIHDLLDDGEQVEGAPRDAVNPRHRDHAARCEIGEPFEKLAPVVVLIFAIRWRTEVGLDCDSRQTT
jgi:hypothetical protein